MYENLPDFDNLSASSFFLLPLKTSAEKVIIKRSKWFEYFSSHRRFNEIRLTGNSFSMLVKFFEKLIFLTPWYVHERIGLHTN